MKRISILLYICISYLPCVNAQILSWQFPINRTHAGVLLGNGTQGLMIWGDTTLNITFARAGFWDRRGGNDFAAKTNFVKVKSLIEKGEEDALRKTFALSNSPNEPNRPQQYGGGVLQLQFLENIKLIDAKLDLTTAKIIVKVDLSKGEKGVIEIEQAIDHELTWIKFSPNLQGKIKPTLKAFYEFNNQKLSSIGVVSPKHWLETNISGFTQYLPSDSPLSAGFSLKNNQVVLATNIGENSHKQVISTINQANIPRLAQQKNEWWKSYWSEVCNVKLPDPILQEALNYGLYKQACATPPHGLACTLQGVFMEEYQLPPWSNDYHLNINAQMIYSPALASNRPQHFKPFLDWLLSVLPVFQRNGQLFFQNPNAYMIPHAVDDKGQVIGNFWTGTLDHATTAWIAYLSFQYYQYSGDSTYLESLTLPLSIGAFEGFWSMLEVTKLPNGQKQYSLPISVSPEFGSGLQGVGKNSSFQLAALHRILKVLPELATILEKQSDPRWDDVAQKLPAYSLVTMPFGENLQGNTPPRIGLWADKDLTISHRHHSHLAGIYPFQTLHLKATEHTDIIKNSYWKWINTGAGAWTGWCIPWASMIHNRMRNTESAISWLHYWSLNFVNEGRGTLHNSTNNGMSMFNEPVWAKEISNGRRNHEIMQLDAGFGVVSAILDLLVSEQADGIHILPNRSWRWKNLSFDRIRTAGGFLISAKVRNDKVEILRVESKLGGNIKIHHGFGEIVHVNGKLSFGEVLTLDLKKNESVIITKN